MRNLALTVLLLATATGGFVGCGGGSTRKPVQTGKAGAGGSTGAAGAGAAGVTGVAGTGAAGDGAAGTGAAGTGAAGTGAAGDGAAGTGAAGAPVPPPCDSMPKKALPYAMGADFTKINVINPNNMNAWKVIENPSCDTTTYPPLNPPADGGADGGDAGTDAAAEGGASTDGGVDGGDGGDDAVTLALDDPDAAADAPVDAPAASDGGDAGDAGAKDGSGDVTASTDAGPAIPACYAFTYNPDPCVAAGLSCWGGVIFAPTETLGNAAPGVCIEAGATKIEFWARSNREGANIKWGAIGPGVGTTEKYIAITTTWTKYTLDSPANYPEYNTTSDTGGVWNGFSVVGDPDVHAGGTYLFVKDIQWIK